MSTEQGRMNEGFLQKAGNGLLFNLSWLAIVNSETLLIALPVALVHVAVHQLWLGHQKTLLFHRRRCLPIFRWTQPFQECKES